MTLKNLKLTKNKKNNLNFQKNYSSKKLKAYQLIRKNKNKKNLIYKKLILIKIN